MSEKQEKPIISKITIEIGDVKAPVTLDQARKLHAALSEMFGIQEKVRIEYVDRYRDWHWPWARPYYSWSSDYGGLSKLDLGLTAAGNCSIGSATALDKMNDMNVGHALSDIKLCASTDLDNLTLRIE